MLAWVEHAQRSIDRVEVVAQLFEALLCGYEIAGEFGSLGSQGAETWGSAIPENMGRRLEFSLNRCYIIPEKLGIGTTLLWKALAFPRRRPG